MQTWEYPIMQSATVDERRRVVMPKECPPHSAVTIQQVDDHSWLVRRQLPDPNVRVVAIPVIRRLADDPAWEKTEAEMAKAVAGRLPEPE